MAQRISYRDIPAKLRNREPFTGNSMSAEWGNDGVYRVLSYLTVIAMSAYGEDNSPWISENKWGRTTGRHINLCKRYL